MSVLSEINDFNDIKKLKQSELDLLARDIRKFLVGSVSKTGGHLASNLGVVELTLALHYCYDPSIDKIIWDVGHQSYVHKILTGRKNQFNTLRKLDGLSGFPKTEESDLDVFNTGHSSTSISAGFGMAKARDLNKEDYKVISVIGDGSISSGLAFEALNNAGRSDADFTVILNDNNMSISENVGAVSRHLNQIRTAPSYIGAKKDVNKFLDKVPVIGEKIGSVIERAKDGIKYLFIPGIMFEEFGFTYIGPVDGHNINELIYVLNNIKRIKGPVFLHVLTKKGKGYKQAERHPEYFHGVGSFDIKTGKNKKIKEINTYSEVFGDELEKIAAENSKVIAITAAMPSGCGLNEFAKKFPNRYFDVGIAESHAVTFAAGMAKSGFVPVFAVYSSFLQRSFDQIIHDVCIQNLPVIFAIDRAGVVGADGETHQGVFDLSYLSLIPNMTIMAPRSTNELRLMLRKAVKLNSPVAIRYPRGVDSAEFEDSESIVEFGKCQWLNKSEKKNIAIVSVGAMEDKAAYAWRKLEDAGIETSFINARFVKPIDKEMIDELTDYDYVFTVEDNVLNGGFGMNLSLLINNKSKNTFVHCFAFPDTFIPQGTQKELYKRYNLDGESIYNEIIKIIEK